ncbi:hypothetical protein [Actinomycetospora soli]|uniref:hypothetical protein n=1 Tax=Actinomycetospora soli TaxID=2893887 RepID=UPI001E388C48|nr:hypothetical protein [Actinomycetospora soli]MCD2191242.1 hypothetical protein [Actinomycetospora soli]
MDPAELPDSLTWERTRRDWRDVGWGRRQTVLSRPGWSDPAVCRDPDDADVVACEHVGHYCLTHDGYWGRCEPGEGSFHQLARRCLEHGFIRLVPDDDEFNGPEGYEPPLTAAQLAYWGWTGVNAHRLSPHLRLGYEPPRRAELREVVGGDVWPARVLRYPDRVDYRPSLWRWWPTPALVVPTGERYEVLALSLAGLGLGAVAGDIPAAAVADLDWVDGLRVGVLDRDGHVDIAGVASVVVDPTAGARADSPVVRALLAPPGDSTSDGPA